ncbi:MAG: SCP2 sterol-binding domain-containing protein [Gammaproteobacteria bacterium]|nr:SCP2 sterol-binding domain-containing protein [Gammaproteobacteria bacterium]MDH4310603.1 SCP2 sterol-binding domain-containing protein [Gammaproteobacteria bacterium]MDH5272623.1 SCP2 sterol-binding domain-containing protein [Gammaproteobacteria bacterium]
MSANPVAAIFHRLSTMLNRNVAQSERASALAQQLEGRALSLVFEGTPITLFFRVTDGRIAIDTRDAGEADATLSGSPISLLSLVGPGAEDRLRGSSIRIAGDAEVAQRFRDLLRHAQPDFEEELSRVVGDVVAHQVANIARGFFDWGRKAADSFSSNVAEYLQEEGRDVPARVEVEEFLEAVDRLREATDRLEARLNRVESRAKSGSK